MDRIYEKKRILLFYAVNHRIQNPLGGVASPSGLSWIAKALKVNNYDSKICDLSLIQQNEEIPYLIKNCIREYKPHAIGISIRNIDTSVNPPRTFFPYLERVSSIIKKTTDVPIILGGPGFSLYAKKCMQIMHGDFGVVGEGEDSFPELLSQIFSGFQKPDVPGLVMKNNGTIQIKTNQHFTGYSTLGKAMHEGIDYDEYNKIGGFYAIQTKRGCSFNCIYCDYPYLEGQRYRMRSPQIIVDEMEDLTKQYSLDYFFFTDSVFNYPTDFCANILKEIIARKLDIKWTAYVNPKGITSELVALFKKSGCSRIEVTIDSASDTTLATYQKHFSVKEIIQVDSYFSTFDIPTYYWVNLGGPGETAETLKENFYNLDRLKHVTKGWVGSGFVVLPGSPLYHRAMNEGLIQDDNLEEPYLYLSDQLPDDCAEQIQKFCINHPAWFSVYDMVDPDYRAMAMDIIDRKIRNHWPMQMDYGIKRMEKYQRGKIKIISQKAFQDGIIKKNSKKALFN